jgi:hypothetical protein
MQELIHLRFLLLTLIMSAMTPSSAVFAQTQTRQQSTTAANSGLPVTAPVPQTIPSAPKQDSLAEAARKARAKRQQGRRSATVFTNDNLPTAGGVSVIGKAVSTTEDGNPASSQGTAAESRDKSRWRARFAALRTKLHQNETALDVMQRELGELNVQYYANPQEALRQGYTRADINNKTATIDATKKDVADIQQQISNLEDKLRISGGDQGWARE